jgi:DNA repair protein RadA/Sms
MLIAVTERASGVKLHEKDVFLATVGGIRLTDPAADLATCLALLSASGDHVSPLDLAILGEVTLTGDVRPVPQLAQRVAEAIRLGYSRLLVPPGTARRVNGQATTGRLIEVPTLAQAVAAFRQLNPAPGVVGLATAPPGVALLAQRERRR